MLHMPYSRMLEKEADKVGLQLAAKVRQKDGLKGTPGEGASVSLSIGISFSAELQSNLLKISFEI